MKTKKNKKNKKTIEWMHWRQRKKNDKEIGYDLNTNFLCALTKKQEAKTKKVVATDWKAFKCK